MANWKFILTDLETTTALTVTDVIGWESVSLNLARSETYSGIFQKATSQLTFIGTGYTFLTALYDSYGINARCSIDCYKFDNNTSGFILVHSGLIDFTTKSENDKYDLNGKAVSFKVLDNDFSTKLFAREKESIPYDRLETLDGDAITPFTNEYRDISLIGMEVLQKVTALATNENYEGDGPDTWVYPSFIINPPPSKPIQNVYGNMTSSSTTKKDCFVITETNENATVTGSLTYAIQMYTSLPATTRNFEIRLSKINFDPITGLYVSFEEIYKREFTANIAYDDTIIINETLTGDQGLAFYTYSWCSYLGVYVKHQIVFYELNGDIENKIDIALSNIYDPSPCKVAMPLEISKRITESITGQQIVESRLFDRVDAGAVSDGAFSMFGFTNGMLLRQFTAGNIPAIEGTKVAQLSFDWITFFKSIESVWNIGCGMENGKFVIEDKKHFFNNTTLLTITDIEADSYTRELDMTMHYSAIEVGYAKAAYEQVSGLEEYNNRTNCTTPISNTENKLTIISETRGDGYGMEFARRKPASSFGSEDTDFDKDNFMISLSAGYVQNDNSAFETIENVEGITRPINLDITPMRNLRRWGWILNSGIYKMLSKVIKYNTSDVVSDLRTKKIDETLEVSECTDVNISDLDVPYFTGHIIKFNAPVSFDDFALIQANPYGIVYFRKPDGTTGSGWIKEVTNSPKDTQTNWSIIEKYPIEDTEIFLATEDDKYLVTESDLKIIV